MGRIHCWSSKNETVAERKEESISKHVKYLISGVQKLNLTLPSTHLSDDESSKDCSTGIDSIIDDLQDVALSTLDLPYISTYMSASKISSTTTQQRVNNYGVKTLEDIEEVQSQENSNYT